MIWRRKFRRKISTALYTTGGIRNTLERCFYSWTFMFKDSVTCDNWCALQYSWDTPSVHCCLNVVTQPLEMTLMICGWYCGRGWPVQVNQRMLCSKKREGTLLKLLGKVYEQTGSAMCVYIHMSLLCHQAHALLKRAKPAMAPHC